MLLVRGSALVWQNAGRPQLVERWTHVFASAELTAVPSSEELGYATRNDAALGLRQDAEELLSSVAQHRGNLAVEVRYIVVPRPGGPSRVRLYLTLRAQAEDAGSAERAAEGAMGAALSALPASFSWQRVSPAVTEPPSECGSSLIEVRREEQVSLPQASGVGTDYYYVPFPIYGDGTGWPRLLATLSRLQEPVVVSLLCTPTILQPEERSALDHIMTGLRFFSEPRTEHDAFGNPYNVPGDGAAMEARQIWERFIRGLDHAQLVRATVLGSKGPARQVVQALAGAVSTVQAGSDSERRWPVATQAPRSENEFRAASMALGWRFVAPWGGHELWGQDDAPHILRRIPYLLSTRDAASLVVLPVPDDQGAEGFPRARRSAARRTALLADDAAEGPGVSLGHLLHEGQQGPRASLPLTAINRHVLIVGAPGSGKTTTVHTLLYSLWRDHRVPWLVIEPVKTEYRSLTKASGLEDLRIFTLGQEDVAPLRLNPLAPPPSVSREEHMSSLMASFTAALPLDGPLPSLLEEALDQTYHKAGWDYGTTSEDGVVPPTLRQVIPAYDDVVREHDYSQEIRDNLTAMISVRLKTMMRGARGRLLDSMESVDWEELMAVPVVVELDSIRNPEEKAMLAAFVIDRVRAAARRRGSSGGELRHVTVFEEAHQLLTKIEATAESARAAAIRAFCDDIAELRALGEGFIVSDQRPTALADAAVANTGTRILHRLESAADRNIVLADLDVEDTHARAAARLSRGEAVLRWPDRDDAEFVQITPPEQVNTGVAVTKSEVADWARRQTQAVQELRPYPLCAGKKWSNLCDAATRSAGEHVAGKVREECEQIWREAEGKPAALEPIVRVLLKETGDDPHRAYCAAVHLATTTKVLNVRRANIAPQLVTAIEDNVGSAKDDGDGW